MKKLLLLSFIFLAMGMLSAQVFEARAVNGLIENDNLDEASGLVASWKNPGVLWSINDSGGQNRLYAFNTLGQNLGEFIIDGVVNRDWEALATGPAGTPGDFYLYIADIGDNSFSHPEYYIYRVEEPVVSSTPIVNPPDQTIFGAESITFTYSFGGLPMDAETLMYDPVDGDLWIVSKRVGATDPGFDYLFKISAPFDFVGPMVATSSAVLTYPADLIPTAGLYMGATGGDVTQMGYEILIRTYFHVYYYLRPPGTPFENAFDEAYYDIPEFDYMSLPPEPQGEAVSWYPDGTGFYTVSEEAANPLDPPNTFPAYLFNYVRTDDPTLPVELSAFTAAIVYDDQVLLSWITQSETDMLGYGVLRGETENPMDAQRINTNLIQSLNQPTETVYTYTDETVDATRPRTVHYWLEAVELDGTVDIYGPATVTFDGQGNVPDAPAQTRLHGAYPNPFNPTTELRFSIRENDVASVVIYNLRGQAIRDFGTFQTGEHALIWDGRDDNGSAVSSGVFFCRLRSETREDTIKLMMLK